MTNPFKVDNYYKDKDNILRTLYDHWETGERNTNYGTTVMPIGRSLSVLDLQDKTSLHRRQIEKLVISLSNSGHIELLEKDLDLNQKNHKWIITESGRQAIADNYYLNQQGLDNRNLFLQFGGIVIALLSLVVAVFGLFYPKQDEEKINSLQKQINKLEQTQTVSQDSTNLKK